jgi:hypothetical protein
MYQTTSSELTVPVYTLNPQYNFQQPLQTITYTQPLEPIYQPYYTNQLGQSAPSENESVPIFMSQAEPILGQVENPSSCFYKTIYWAGAIISIGLIIFALIMIFRD